MSYVDVEVGDNRVAVVTLNRPERLNALGPTLVAEATAAFRSLDRDHRAAAVVLTGAGRGFCSGADLSGEADFAPDSESRGPVGRVHRAQEHIVELMLSVHECEKPVVCAAHGAAVGGGLALALASDLRVATPTTRFASQFIKVGLSSCDIGTSYFLPRLVGPTRAAELMLTGRPFSGEEADRFGMLNALVPEGEHVAAAVELAEQIAENSEFGIWMTKRGLWANVDAPSLRHAVELENRTQVLGTFTGNMAEAVAAFQQKRPPAFGPF